MKLGRYSLRKKKYCRNSKYLIKHIYFVYNYQWVTQRKSYLKLWMQCSLATTPITTEHFRPKKWLIWSMMLWNKWNKAEKSVRLNWISSWTQLIAITTTKLLKKNCWKSSEKWLHDPKKANDLHNFILRNNSNSKILRNQLFLFHIFHRKKYSRILSL